MGSLIKRKNGYWYGIFRLPGRVHPIWISLKTKNKTEALRKFAQLEEQFESTGILKIQEIRFSDFCKKYLDWAQGKKRYNTFRLERGIIENHLKPFFGSLNLNWIHQRDIDRYISERKKAKVKARTINIELGSLAFMLKKGIEWGHLRKLPFDRNPKLKEIDSEQRRALTEQEVCRLLESAQGNAKLFIALLVYTGMRLSEALFLEWNDIDLEKEEIRVKSKPEAGFKTKSGRSRIIPMSPELKEILIEIENKSGWLFKNEKGERIKSLRKSFETACKKAGIEGITPHCLRHTFATLMIQRGVDARTLADILGHASPTTTLQIYSHSFDSAKRQAIRKLPSFAPSGKIIPFPAKK